MQLPADHDHEHEHEHEVPEGLSPEELRAWNIAEVTKALMHLSKRNAAREWSLAEIERVCPNPIEVQAARLEFVLAALIPDELQRLFLEYSWQQSYAVLLDAVAAQARIPIPTLNGNGSTPKEN